MAQLLFMMVLGEIGAEILEFPSTNISMIVLVCTYIAEKPTSNLCRWDFHCERIFFVGEFFKSNFILYRDHNSAVKQTPWF